MHQRFKFDRCFKVDRNYPVTFKWPARADERNECYKIYYVIMLLNNEDKCDIDKFPFLLFTLLLSRIGYFSFCIYEIGIIRFFCIFLFLYIFHILKSLL